MTPSPESWVNHPAKQGVDINKIQDILGRGSPTITKLIYVEVTREGQRDTGVAGVSAGPGGRLTDRAQ